MSTAFIAHQLPRELSLLLLNKSEMALSQLGVLILALTQAGGEGCVEDDVRLVGRDSLFEGRVEICRGGIWGRVCAGRWSRNDATVVCRQLGFSRARATQEPGTDGPIFLDYVQCGGAEEMLASCTSISEDINRCYSNQDAGAECEGVTVELSRNGRSVHVEWNILYSFDVILNFSHAINTSGHQIIHSSIVTLPESETQFEYDGLLPAPNYSVCVHDYNTYWWESTCTSIQIPPQSTTSINFVTSSSSSSSSSCSITEGILGSIIAVLVFLLIVAGVGLAYPRCIRHRVKDKKYLSNISQFLDSNMYLTSNDAYKVHSKRRHDQQRAERGGGTGNTVSPATTLGTREAVDQQYSVLSPTPGEPNHITATVSDTVPQHYEMSSNTATINDTVAQHYEMSSATLAQSRHYEVPAKDRNDEYSHLEY